MLLSAFSLCNIIAGAITTDDGLAKLQFSLINNLGNNSNVYFTGTDSNGNAVMLLQNGTYYTPKIVASQVPVQIAENVAIPLGPQGSITNITLPDYIKSARVWFVLGTLDFFAVVSGSGIASLVMPSFTNAADPNVDVNYGFFELDFDETSGIYVNLSYVDFVGVPLGLSLTPLDDTPIQEAKGLPADTVSKMCDELRHQAVADSIPWDELCQYDKDRTALRVVAPLHYFGPNPDAFNAYWKPYIDQVFTKYTTEILEIDTQAAPGILNCQVRGDVLICDGDEYTYAKPNANDIFGCNSGPFAPPPAASSDVHKAVVPRLCAAFNRSTFLIQGGNLQPSASHGQNYASSPTNHYSRIVHKFEMDGTGYAFPYDDVNSSGEDESGILATTAAAVITVSVGSPLT